MKGYFVAEGYMGYVNGEYKYTSTMGHCVVTLWPLQYLNQKGFDWH